MKISDIFEMTMRIGNSVPEYNMDNLQNLDWSYSGIMQHGYSVIQTSYQDSIIYAIKDNDKIISFTQLKEYNIPNYGIVYETTTSQTNQQYSGSSLNYKLKYYLVHHLGLPILLGNVHSNATENVLKKIDDYFNIKLINIKNGNMVDWSYENYIRLTSKFETTE